MEKVAENIPGYTYGTSEVPASPVTMEQLAQLKITNGFTQEDADYLRMAGDVLKDQTKQIVDHWRSGIIAGIPRLARHSRTPEGDLNPEYLAKSNLRFQQWILDTCLRPYDQQWLNYQQEIALRHTSLKKNKTDILGFISVINETIKPYLAAKGHSAQEVDAMHRAWCKSIQLQMALWSLPYTNAQQAPNEW
jgi:hypothetical protein